jgi:PBSX family phage portal protein
VAYGNHTAQLAPEDEVIEIDIESIVHSELTKKEEPDPFDKVNIASFKKNAPVVKRYEQLRKKYVGVEGAESKYIDPEQIYGYSLYNVVEPPYDLAALGQLYDESSILHSVIDSRVMNTVGLGYGWEPTLKAKKQIERGNRSIDAADRVRTSHQKEQDSLNDRFDNFNEEETFIETLIRIWLDVLTLGNGYMEIGRTKTGKIGYIGHVPGTLVRVRRPRDGYVQIANLVSGANIKNSVYFRNFGDSTTKDPINGDSNPNELIHFKLYTPNNSYYGIPPSVSALPAIIGDKFAKQFNIDYFENKAIPRYAIILKGVKLSEKSKRELIQYFRNEVKGKNHGTLVIPIPATIGSNNQADVKFEKLEADIQEGSFDKYRKSNRDEIISAYRVPPTKVGIFENANLAVSRDADKTFKSQVVGPDQTIAEKKINRVVKEFSDLFKIKLAQLDVIDEDLRSRIHDRYARIGAMNINEIRQIIGLQPVEGGDKALPFPIKTGYQNGKPWPNLQAIQGAPKADGGAPPGNTNSNNPAKSGQDNGSNASNADATGTNNERGQSQDQGKGRERSSK